jgi:hypothetical protein
MAGGAAAATLTTAPARMQQHFMRELIFMGNGDVRHSHHQTAPATGVKPLQWCIAPQNARKSRAES